MSDVSGGDLLGAVQQRSTTGARRPMRRRLGFDDAFLYEEMKKPLGERTIPMEVNVCPEEAWKSFCGVD